MFEDNVRVDPTLRFPALAAAIAELPLRPDRGGTAAACAADTRALLELTRALQARLHAQLACLDEQGFAETLGCASSTAWLAVYANLDRSQARRMVLAARTADRLPLLGARHGAGKIGPEHLAALGSGAPRVPVEVLAESDKTFADFSGSARPGELRLVAQRLQAAYDQDAVTEDADHAHQARRLTLSRTFDDTWFLDGQLEAVDGAALDLALQSLMAPHGSDDDRTITQRRADALIELTQLALTGGQLPATGGDRPRLTFLVTTPTTTGSQHDGSSPDPAGGPTDIGCTHRWPGPGEPAADLADALPPGGCHAGCPTSRENPIPWPEKLTLSFAPSWPTLGPDEPDQEPDDDEPDHESGGGEPDDSEPDPTEWREGEPDQAEPDDDEPDGGEWGRSERVSVGDLCVTDHRPKGKPRAVELDSVEDRFHRPLIDGARFGGALFGGALSGAGLLFGAGLVSSGSARGLPRPDETMLAVAGFGDGITDTSAQLLGGHSMLPATTIARIGCTAELSTATLNAAGDVLNYGRTHRRHSRGQGRAVALRDQHCVFPGCDVPPWRCIVHHLEFWDHGGPTNLDHLALLCLFHHRRVHEHGWWLQRHQDHPNATITWVATDPDGHQLRQPRQPAA